MSNYRPPVARRHRPGVLRRWGWPRGYAAVPSARSVNLRQPCHRISGRGCGSGPHRGETARRRQRHRLPSAHPGARSGGAGSHHRRRRRHVPVIWYVAESGPYPDDGPPWGGGSARLRRARPARGGKQHRPAGGNCAARIRLRRRLGEGVRRRRRGRRLSRR